MKIKQISLLVVCLIVYSMIFLVGCSDGRNHISVTNSVSDWQLGFYSDATIQDEFYFYGSLSGSASEETQHFSVTREFEEYKINTHAYSGYPCLVRGETYTLIIFDSEISSVLINGVEQISNSVVYTKAQIDALPSTNKYHSLSRNYVITAMFKVDMYNHEKVFLLDFVYEDNMALVIS